MAAVLKVESDGEIRRLLLDAVPEYDTVCSGLLTLWPTCDVDQAKYRDDEGDLCTLSPATFEDFLSHSPAGAAGRRVLRLLVPQRGLTSAPAEPAPEVPAAAAAAESEEVADSARPSACGATPTWSDAADASASEEDDWHRLEAEAEAAEDAEADAAEDAAPEEHAIEEEWDEEMFEAAPVADLAGDVPVFPIHTPPPSPRGACGNPADAVQDAPEPSQAAEQAAAAAHAAAQAAAHAAAQASHAASQAAGHAGFPMPPLPAESLDWPDASSSTTSSFSLPATTSSLGVAAGAAGPAGPGGAEAPDAARAAATLAELDAHDKVLMILAAFDANGDGCLSFEECGALQRAAWGGEVPLAAYQELCGQLGAEEGPGLGADALAVVYSDSGNLERDYQAALRVLEAAEAPNTAPSAPPEAAAPSDFPPGFPSCFATLLHSGRAPEVAGYAIPAGIAALAAAAHFSGHIGAASRSAGRG